LQTAGSPQWARINNINYKQFNEESVMKTMLSYILIFSLVLTIAVSVMPINQSSLIMNDTQMMLAVGGRNAALAAMWGMGGILCACTGPVGAFGAGICYGMAVSFLY
jgi:hypothetical protein